MDWDTYYDRFYDWAESTQISRISSLTDFGSSDEVAEVAQEISDEKAASRLIKKAVAAGVKFTADEITDLQYSCTDEAIVAMVDNSDCKFTKEQLDELQFLLPDRILDKVAKRSNVSLDDSDTDDEIEPLIYEEKTPKLGFFATLAIANGIFSLLNSKPARHDGRCNGDCRNCPPHYGYRYGRWYYGHSHVHGCEFGGNKGDGSMF